MVTMQGSEVIKLFSCSTQLSTKFQMLIKLKYRQMMKFFALSLSDVVFIMLINIKMPTIVVGILTFMSRIHLVLNGVEYEKKFYNLWAWPAEAITWLKSIIHKSCHMRFPTMWYVRPAKAQTSLRIRAVWSEQFASRLNITWVLSYWLNTFWSFEA